MRKWKLYNNGEETRKFYEGDPIPEGWVPGYSEKRRAEILETRKRTNLEKFGVDIVFKSSEAREKAKKTNMERYGVENPFQSEEIKECIKRDNLKKYGVEYTTQRADVQERTKKTNLDKYGTEYTFQAESVKEKIKDTLVERYGVEHPLQSEEILNSMKERNLEKYGKEYVTQVDEFKDKARKTSLDRYGYEYATQSPEIREKTVKTSLERYGVECNFQSEDTKKKKVQSYLEHYGVEHPSQSEEIKERKKQTCLKHFGVEYSLQSDEVKQKVRESNLKRYGHQYALQSDEMKERVKKTCQEKYGVDWACMRPEAKLGYSNNSGPNRSFERLLINEGINYSREYSMSKYVYDFKVEDSVLIEIDPSATHNSLWNPYNHSEDGLNPTYHQNKSRFAEQYGYHVIHVFDWDDLDKVIKLLSSRNRIYARKCDIREVHIDECGEFLQKYHLQGSCKGQKFRLGLYFEDTLVSLMTFGKPRYNSNYKWELLRYCSSYNVVGGAEKLFKHFIKMFNPESVISYCDRSKFRGDIYKTLGFNLKSSGSPSKHWFGTKTGEHYTDNFIRQRGFDQIFKTNYGKGTSNEELLINHGFIPVYDCGQDTYVWKRY